MKRLSLYFIISLVISQSVMAQNSFPATGLTVLNSGEDRAVIIKDGRAGTNWDYIEWQFSNGTRDWVLGRRSVTGYFTLYREGLNEVLTVDNSGRVGIGTTTPGAKLHINSAVERESLRLYKDGNTTNYLSVFQGTGGAAIDPIGTGKLWLGYDQATDVYMGNNTGKVGIGTTTPGYKLDVVGPANDWKARFQGSDGYITIGPANPYWAHIYTDRPNFLFNQNVYSIGAFSSYSTADLALQTNGSTRLTISNSSGNVGIGTTSPNQKLTVNGTIYGKEVKVDLSVPGPDYVFEKNYKLPSLEEIKSYIDQYKHLPEVPSAKEMEANGINVGEMNMILLKKVEELTLMLIEAKNEMRKQSEQNMQQQKEINDLKQEFYGHK